MGGESSFGGGGGGALSLLRSTAPLSVGGREERLRLLPNGKTETGGCAGGERGGG